MTGEPMGPAAGLGIKPHVRVCPEISGTCYKPRIVTSISLSLSTSLKKNCFKFIFQLQLHDIHIISYIGVQQ